MRLSVHISALPWCSRLKPVLVMQVTETDQLCESTIISTIKRKYPEHAFIGEESSADQGSVDSLTDAPTWIIDPLDGTTNFVHKFPFVCVCIGLAIGKKVRATLCVFKSVLSSLSHCLERAVVQQRTHRAP